MYFFYKQNRCDFFRSYYNDCTTINTAKMAAFFYFFISYHIDCITINTANIAVAAKIIVITREKRI